MELISVGFLGVAALLLFLDWRENTSRRPDKPFGTVLFRFAVLFILLGWIGIVYDS